MSAATRRVGCKESEEFGAKFAVVEMRCPDFQANLGAGICQKPGLFMTVNTSRNQFRFDYIKVAWMLVPTFLAVLGTLSLLMPLSVNKLQLVGRPIHIEDISPGGERVIIKSVRPHRLCKRRIDAIFVRTGHFMLDSNRRFQVRPIDTARLELLDEDGKPLPQRVDASMGELRLSASQGLVYTMLPGPFPMPVLPFALLFWAMAAIGLSIISHEPRVRIVEAVIASVVSLLLGLMGSLLQRYFVAKSQTSLADCIRQFDDDLNNPSPKACERGPGRAVTALKLFAFYEYFSGFIRDRTMYYIDPNIVRPLTHAYKLSFAERIGPSQVQWFISHWWGTMSRNFIAAIKKHAMSTCSPDDPDSWMQLAYWICTYSNNQYRVAEEIGKSHKESSFYLALHSPTCCGTCMILDEEARPLTRSWCLFELLQTLELEKENHHSKASCSVPPLACLTKGSPQRSSLLILGSV